jgi:hypothetical protein
MDTTIARVTFYMEGRTPLAVFKGRRRSNGHRYDNYECYSHIGQHSQAAPEYIKRLKKATPEQYKDLKEELESIGYQLIVNN